MGNSTYNFVPLALGIKIFYFPKGDIMAVFEKYRNHVEELQDVEEVTNNLEDLDADSLIFSKSSLKSKMH